MARAGSPILAKRAGVPVVAHEPHWVEAGAESSQYLDVKRAKLGHLA